MAEEKKYYFGTKESVCAMCIEICLEQDGLEPDCSQCHKKFFTKDEIIVKILDPMHDYDYRTWYAKGEKAFNNLLGVKNKKALNDMKKELRLEVGKKYITESGREVEIFYQSDCRATPYLGIVKEKGGYPDAAIWYNPDGTHNEQWGGIKIVKEKK